MPVILLCITGAFNFAVHYHVIFNRVIIREFTDDEIWTSQDTLAIAANPYTVSDLIQSKCLAFFRGLALDTSAQELFHKWVL